MRWASPTAPALTSTTLPLDALRVRSTFWLRRRVPADRSLLTTFSDGRPSIRHDDHVLQLERSGLEAKPSIVRRGNLLSWILRSQFARKLPRKRVGPTFSERRNISLTIDWSSAVVNDLHKGRDTGAWATLIDLSAVPDDAGVGDRPHPHLLLQKRLTLGLWMLGAGTALSVASTPGSSPDLSRGRRDGGTAASGRRSGRRRNDADSRARRAISCMSARSTYSGDDRSGSMFSSTNSWTKWGW